jgi:hypothetical protein
MSQVAFGDDKSDKLTKRRFYKKALTTPQPLFNKIKTA